MKAEYLNSVIISVTDVIKKIFNADVQKETPYIFHHDANVSHLAAVIQMHGDKKGAFVLSLSEEVAKKLASNILHEEKKNIDRDVIDVIGELINIITGSTKGLLSQQGFTFKFSTPTYILGKGTRLLKDDEYAPYICIPFTSMYGRFTIMISLR